MTVPLMFQPLVKYAQFDGRSRRSEFWLWMLFRFLLSRAIGIVAMMFIAPSFMQLSDLASHPEAMNAHPEQFMHTFMQTYLQTVFSVLPWISLVGLALFLPTLTVTIRRLHDINRTGWWVVLPYAVLIIGLIAWMAVGGVSLFSVISHAKDGNVPDAEGAKFALGFIGGLFLCVLLPELIAWIVMLVFFVTEGTKGSNRFGADPKADTQTRGF